MRRRFRLHLWRPQAVAMVFWLILLAYLGWTEYRISKMRAAVSELIEMNSTQLGWNDEAMARLNALTGFEIDRQLREQRSRQQAVTRF